MEYSVHYSSLATPPKSIDVTHSFTVVKDNGKYVLMDNGIKRNFGVNFIKCFFSPDKGTWEDIIK